ncbi:nuclear transport factor 2 family protein [Telluria aromaticivorans]|uniref:Nuclear transport factor 2 family protein n=1 Tax=Telluria aromaticivorans TaxID=2725995 RepID=A0A7Y2JZ17_9BURK|nr:nuclear transport factor 2 family protein [Telluria aromaticivorans]NNG23642.1 nuclear transport factor 2 family protein [Telluria aromaticivorans]
MSTLPQAISAYIDAANAQALDRVAACFHPDAKVVDEGHVHQGRAQIQEWAAESSARYQATIKPLGLSMADEAHMLRATVRGNFPGSPIELDFQFVLRAGAIDALEIKP